MQGSVPPGMLRCIFLAIIKLDAGGVFDGVLHKDDYKRSLGFSTRRSSIDC